MKKSPGQAGGLLLTAKRSDVGAARYNALGTRGLLRQFNRQRHGVLVAEDAQLHCSVFFIALAGKLFAEFASGTNAFAVQRSDDVARLNSRFFRGRAGIYLADEY